MKLREYNRQVFRSSSSPDEVQQNEEHRAVERSSHPPRRRRPPAPGRLADSRATNCWPSTARCCCRAGIDDKEIQLKNQSLIFFQISGAGHEAVLVAAGPAAARRLRLVLSVLSRSRALPDARRDAVRDVPRRGRRQGRPGQRRPPDAVALGPQASQHRLAVEPDRHAVPPGDWLRRSRDALRAGRRHPGSRSQRFKHDEVVYVSLGDGTASEGEFWESLNAACVRKLPVVFLVEDNGYAISVPVEVQTPGGDLSRLVESFPGLGVFRCDGTDVLDSLQTMQAGGRVRARAARPGVRPREGHPAVLALALRRRAALQDAGGAGGGSDARSDHEVRGALTAEGLITDAELADARPATSIARSTRPPTPRSRRRNRPKDTAGLWVYSPDVDPTSPAFDVRAEPEGKPDTMVAAINRTLKDEMAVNPRIVVFGEDVADATHDGEPHGSAGQGRRLQGDARPAEGVRLRSRVQLGARRSRHHRPRRRHGHARHQAGRRNPVLRLHLAGDDAAPQRSVDAAVPVEQPLLVSDGHPRRDRRLPARRRAVPQPVGREHLRALPGHPHRVSVERAGCRGPAAHGHSLRRSRALHGAQAPLPADLQQGALPRQQLHDPVRQGRRPPRGHRRRGRHLGRAGAAIAAGGAAGREGRREHDGHRPANHHAVRLGRDRRRRPTARTASSSRTKISSRAGSAPSWPRASPASCSSTSTRRSAASARWTRRSPTIRISKKRSCPARPTVLTAILETARY